MMKAWQVQGAGEPKDVLHLVDVEVPEPGPGQLRIRVTAAGIGLPDVFMCRGTYALTPPLPFTPGQEASGVVTAVGEGVDAEIGARVMGVTVFYKGHGSFAEECLLGADTAFPIPKGLTDAECLAELHGGDAASPRGAEDREPVARREVGPLDQTGPRGEVGDPEPR